MNISSSAASMMQAPVNAYSSQSSGGNGQVGVNDVAAAKMVKSANEMQESTVSQLYASIGKGTQINTTA